MAAKFCKEGYRDILSFFMTSFGTANIFCALFKTNHTPAITDNLATYTAIQCDFSGYTAGGISPSGWTDTSYTLSDEAQYTAASVNWSTFISGTVNNVYGWFVYDNLNGRLLGAELFPGGPYSMGNGGDSFTLVAHITDTSE